MQNTRYVQPDWMDGAAYFVLRGIDFALTHWPVSFAVLAALVVLTALPGAFGLLAALAAVGGGVLYEYRFLPPVPESLPGAEGVPAGAPAGAPAGSPAGSPAVAQPFAAGNRLPAGVEYCPRKQPDPAAFDRVIGLEKAKEVTRDALIAALDPEHREKYRRYGIRPPKGLLLYGPPGTGKTSFARAAAEMYGTAFYVVNASSIISGYVGGTEENIRSLFSHAKTNRPAVIFFDEFDAIGQKRTGQSINSPSDLAINTLLACLDGFSGSDGVFVIAATNRPDTLDEALTRPGRFDLKVEIGNPDEKSRLKLFELYLQGRPNSLSRDDLKYLARATDGMSPAGIRAAVDRAALYAAKEETEITRNHVQEALRDVSGRGAQVNARPVDEVLAELDAMPGLYGVKRQVRKLLALAEAQVKRREQGLPPLKQSLHMAFTGNPGTGKTTVARLIGELFAGLGLLNSGHLVTASKSDLVAGYVGQTSGAARKVIEKALDGVLFIDEAYELADQGFGSEAITELIQAMENQRDRLVVIFAGYSDVVERLQKVNEGVKSRIGQIIEFPDYSAGELAQIAGLVARGQGFSLDGDAQNTLLAHFRQVEGQIGKLGNGRYARNVVERAISAVIERDPGAAVITGADVAAAVGQAVQRTRSLDEIWAEIDGLVGLASVKSFLREVEAVAKANVTRREKGLPALKQSLHMCFTGNPGTGKTTVARLVGELLAAVGALPGGHMVETDRSGLVASYVGQTAQKVREVVDRAMGGVLFVDEAYSLARGGPQDFGAEALDALIKAMEDHRDKLVVILAGYTREMQDLFALNSGLESRIAFTCEFPDYSPAELVEIARLEARKQGFRLADGVEAALLEMFRQVDIGAAGNGRYARKLVEAAVRKAVLAGRADVLEAGDFSL